MVDDQIGKKNMSKGGDQEMLGIGMLVKDEREMEEDKKREGAYDLGYKRSKELGS